MIDASRAGLFQSGRSRGNSGCGASNYSGETEGIMTRRDESEVQSSLLVQAESKSPGFFAEFFAYLRENRKWWLIPIAVILLLASALVVLSSSAVGPFIYPLF